MSAIYPYEVRYFRAREPEAPSPREKSELNFLYSLDQKAIAVQGETDTPGLKLDFNSGLRLVVPPGDWRVVIKDGMTGEVFFDDSVAACVLLSWEKYYVEWQVEIYRAGEPIFSHRLDLTGQKIHIACMGGRLGDFLAFLPYVREMSRRYHGEVTYSTIADYRELAHLLLPDISWREQAPPDNYATYQLTTAIDFPGGSPFDGRTIPLHHLGKVILGLPNSAELVLPPAKKNSGERYVCIGVQASSVLKGWLYPGGWEEIVSYLRAKGYRVLCIDKEPYQELHGIEVRMPQGAEDYTGNRPITERWEMLRQADFFIGLSSGLAWLAHVAGIPVVMICGFSRYWWEFATPYRVYNPLVCNGCVQDLRVNWHLTACPRFTVESPRLLECTRKISPLMVKRAIDRLMTDDN
ncbi:MAG: autotransporter strand-loop-strand O-heptosyltransferase [Selenomonadaceae bacterium]|nr:autotransporter strand-loop-strand O-heptosyltransferase [Selenomonadaceae bacterium]